MKVFVLYNDKRYERYHPLMEELVRQKVTEFEIFPAVYRKTVVESINAGFKAIVEIAKADKMPEVAIWEDDCCFPSEDGWQYFLNNKPESFDIYLGGTYLKDTRWQFTAPYTKVPAYIGNHCIIISEKYYDRFLSVSDFEHIDTAQEGGDYYVCYPFPALQRKGFSANNMAMANYNEILKPEDIYGSLHNVS